MLPFHITPTVLTLLILWISSGHSQLSQYDPYYGDSPFYGEPQQFGPYSPPGARPQTQPPQQFYPFDNNENPFLPTGQGQAQSQQQRIQGYPNLPSVPFQTVTPNPNQRVDRYPFPPQQTPSFSAGDPWLPTQTQNNQYPKIPDFPFNTVQPSAVPPLLPPVLNTYPKIELPRIRVIEFATGEYFEYGGGKLVQPKRANSDLYVGGVGGDVPITSKIFIECTGPNQVQWVYNSSSAVKNYQKPLSVVTKNFQITIPEERGPTPGSREYTYLRLGLEQQITELDSGVYICRDRILPQNYITIRVLVASRLTGGYTSFPFTGAHPPPSSLPPYNFGAGHSSTLHFGTPSLSGETITGNPSKYPFVPKDKDPNTVYYSQSDSTVVLPCKIENADATITLHKHEVGKLSCPYNINDGRVSYDRFKGFTLQTRSFNNLEGRYVCVGDFSGELKLMKYKLVASEDFTTRYVEGELQNIISLDGEQKSGAASPFLAEADSIPTPTFLGANQKNLTAAGFIDPRSEFEDESDNSFALVPEFRNTNSSTTGNNTKASKS